MERKELKGEIEREKSEIKGEPNKLGPRPDEKSLPEFISSLRIYDCSLREDTGTHPIYPLIWYQFLDKKKGRDIRNTATRSILKMRFNNESKTNQQVRIQLPKSFDIITSLRFPFIPWEFIDSYKLIEKNIDVLTNQIKINTTELPLKNVLSKSIMNFIKPNSIYYVEIMLNRDLHVNDLEFHPDSKLIEITGLYIDRNMKAYYSKVFSA